MLHVQVTWLALDGQMLADTRSIHCCVPCTSYTMPFVVMSRTIGVFFVEERAESPIIMAGKYRHNKMFSANFIQCYNYNGLLWTCKLGTVHVHVCDYSSVTDT